MTKTALLLLTLALALGVAGCGKGNAGQPAAGNSQKEKATVESTGSTQPDPDPAGSTGRTGPKPESPGSAQAPPEVKESRAPAVNSVPPKPPDIVIKTDNRVSSQEASAILDAVDKQLTDLMNTLGRLDDVDDSDLQY
jgi:PBP1b-binding outer membrane lipoprotein LpoB